MADLLVQGAHWGLALVPVLIMLAVFVWLDAFKLMNFGEIAVLLVLGGVAALVAYPISGRFIDALPIGFSAYSSLVAPWIEEALKGAVILILFRLNRIGYKVDAVISGFAVGAGFSVVENIFYLVDFPSFGAGTWLVRGLGTAVMHGTTLAVLAAIVHQLAERETREAAGGFEFRLWWFVPGYLAAAAIHMAFNQFADRPVVAMLGTAVAAPVIMISVFVFGTSEAERWLAADAADHRAQAEALKAGRWPEGPASAKVTALAERMGSDTANRVRRYWELLAWLSAEAEEALLEEAGGKAELRAGEVRAAVAELDGLKRALGRSTVVVLRALLPFSRNDYWELAELRQRLSRS